MPLVVYAPTLSPQEPGVKLWWDKIPVCNKNKVKTINCPKPWNPLGCLDHHFFLGVYTYNLPNLELGVTQLHHQPPGSSPCFRLCGRSHLLKKSHSHTQWWVYQKSLLDRLPFPKGKVLWPLLQRTCCKIGLCLCKIPSAFTPFPKGCQKKWLVLFSEAECPGPFFKGSVAKKAGFHGYFLQSSALIFLASSLVVPSFSKAVLIMSITFTYCLLIFSVTSTMCLGLPPLLLHPHRYALGGLVANVLVILCHAPVHSVSSAAGMQAAGLFKLPAAAGLFIHFFKCPTPIAALRCPCSGSSPCTFWPTLFCKSLLGFASLFFHAQVFSRRKESLVNPWTHHCFVSSTFSGGLIGLSIFQWQSIMSFLRPELHKLQNVSQLSVFQACEHAGTSGIGTWPFQLSQVCQQDIHPVSPGIAPYCPIMATGVQLWLVCQESQHGIPQWLGMQLSLWGYFDQVLQQTQAIYEPLWVRCGATWQKLISFEVLNPIFMLTENLQKQASLNERLAEMPWASSFCSHPFCKGLFKPLLQGNGDVPFPKGICWQVYRDCNECLEFEPKIAVTNPCMPAIQTHACVAQKFKKNKK